MIRRFAQLPQVSDHIRWLQRQTGIGGVRQDPNYAMDGCWTSSPTMMPLPGKPTMRRIVKRMRRIKQCNQHVHIRQRHCRLGLHNSSRRRLISSRVGLGAPGLGSNKRTPLRTRPCGLGSSPFRASREIARPKLMPSASEISRATATMSSSRSNVVRMA